MSSETPGCITSVRINENGDIIFADITKGLFDPAGV